MIALRNFVAVLLFIVVIIVGVHLLLWTVSGGTVDLLGSVLRSFT